MTLDIILQDLLQSPTTLSRAHSLIGVMRWPCTCSSMESAAAWKPWSRSMRSISSTSLSAITYGECLGPGNCRSVTCANTKKFNSRQMFPEGTSISVSEQLASHLCCCRFRDRTGLGVFTAGIHCAFKGQQMGYCWVAQEAYEKDVVHWRAHLSSVLLQCFLDGGANCCVLLAELGRHLGVVRVLHHAQQIMVHQHLPHHTTRGLTQRNRRTSNCA